MKKYKPFTVETAPLFYRHLTAQATIDEIVVGVLDTDEHRQLFQDTIITLAMRQSIGAKDLAEELVSRLECEFTTHPKKTELASSVRSYLNGLHVIPPAYHIVETKYNKGMNGATPIAVILEETFETSAEAIEVQFELSSARAMSHSLLTEGVDYTVVRLNETFTKDPYKMRDLVAQYVIMTSNGPFTKEVHNVRSSDRLYKDLEKVSLYNRRLMSRGKMDEALSTARQKYSWAIPVQYSGPSEAITTFLTTNLYAKSQGRLHAEGLKTVVALQTVDRLRNDPKVYTQLVELIMTYMNPDKRKSTTKMKEELLPVVKRMQVLLHQSIMNDYNSESSIHQYPESLTTILKGAYNSYSTNIPSHVRSAIVRFIMLEDTDNLNKFLAHLYDETSALYN